MDKIDIKKYKPINQEEGGKVTYTKKDIDDKFNNVNFLLYGVVIILIVMIATLIIDSFHINSTIYKEYSEKINTLNDLRKNNNYLLDQNKHTQDLILKQQQEIIDILNKK